MFIFTKNLDMLSVTKITIILNIKQLTGWGSISKSFFMKVLVPTNETRLSTISFIY